MPDGILATSSNAGSAGLGGAFSTISGASFFTAATYGAGIVSFLLIFAVLVCGLSNEVVISRRLIMFARVAILLLVVANGVQLNLDMDLPTDQPVTAPSFRLVRPIVELVLMFLAFFVSSHHIFRWLVVGLQPLFIVAETFTGVQWWVEMECRADGTCLKQGGYSERQVQILAFLQFVMVFLQIWLVLTTAYLLMSMGACHSRYPVRLFSLARPLKGVATTTQKPTSANGSAATTAKSKDKDAAAAIGFGAKTSALAAAGTAKGRPTRSNTGAASGRRPSASAGDGDDPNDDDNDDDEPGDLEAGRGAVSAASAVARRSS